jgi:hypothetical protein
MGPSSLVDASQMLMEESLSTRGRSVMILLAATRELSGSRAAAVHS